MNGIQEEYFQEIVVQNPMAQPVQQWVDFDAKLSPKEQLEFQIERKSWTFEHDTNAREVGQQEPTENRSSLNFNFEQPFES